MGPVAVESTGPFSIAVDAIITSGIDVGLATHLV